MKGLVTSLDVARLAQVSRSAVSRSFTGGASVSDITRAKVLEAAHRLGYRPNAHARSLTTGRSRIIGLVLSSVDNLFYPGVLECMARRLQDDGLHVLLFVADQRQTDELVCEILQYQVDGIVLAASTLSSNLAARCADAGIAVVQFNRVVAAGSGSTVSSVRSDNLAGGHAIARHLLATGHRRMAFIAGLEDSSTSLERERGFREGLAEQGQRIHGRGVGHYDPQAARAAAIEIFRPRAARPDAVFVASDHMAFAVMDALRHDLGLRVPEDVSVAGFDNVPQAAWASYALTTVEQPVAAMVDATLGLLRRQLGDGAGAARHVVLPVSLVVRHSTRAAAPARRAGSRTRLRSDSPPAERMSAR